MPRKGDGDHTKGVETEEEKYKNSLEDDEGTDLTIQVEGNQEAAGVQQPIGKGDMMGGVQGQSKECGCTTYSGTTVLCGYHCRTDMGENPSA